MKIINVKSCIVLIAILAVNMMSPVFAYADPIAGGLGNSMLTTSYNSLSTNTLLSIISYVIGVILCVFGLIRLKAWGDGQVNFSDGLWRILGGSFMVALPDFIDKIENSFFGGAKNWTAGSSASGAMDRTSGLTAVSTPGSGWLGLDQAMENFVIDIYAPAKAVSAWAAWTIGLVCVITGVYRLAQSGQAAQGKAPSAKGTAGYIFGGALMLAAGNLMDVVSTTLFGSDFSTKKFSALATTIPGADSTAVNHVVQAMFAFVEIIGWIAFIRGIFLLVKLAQGGHEKSHAHAFSHIVFGAAAVNMYAMVSMIQKTLGVNLVE